MSAIVIASLDSARSKAVISGGKAFAAQVDLAEGDQAVLTWDFTECSGGTAGDASGNGNTGTLGGVTWSTDTPYGLGCSILFSAGNTVYGSSASVANFTNNQPFTVSVWVNFSSLNTANIGFVGTANYLSGGWMLGNSPNSTNGLSITADCPAYQSQVISGPNVLTTGAWTHIAVVYDGTQGYIYKNGNLVAQGVLNTPCTNPYPVTVGSGPQGGWTGKFQGEITRVHIFQKALTAMDVSRLYAAESSKFIFAGR